MLGSMRRPCPLHGAAVVASCEWCSLGDRNLAIEQIRERVHAAIRATEPGAMPFAVMIDRCIGDALLAEVAVSVPGHAVQSRLYLVKPDAVLSFD